MENKIILIDTSILIDYYRKTDKNNSVWLKLVRDDYSFAISVITKYEIYAGATPSQVSFWDSILQAVSIIPLDELSIDTAVIINGILKKKRKQIDLADLLIAATAVANDFPLATLNKKHFTRIEELKVLD